MEKVRIDKWLWSVRIFGSRTLATKACDRNNVKIDNEIAKPSTNIKVNTIIQVHKNGYNLIYKVTKLISKRVSASLATLCYESLTTEEELSKFENWYIGKGKSEFREKGIGRPTKKDRRLLDYYKNDKIN